MAVSADVCSKELFHALTFDARRSGYRSAEVSSWTDRLDPGRWYRPAQAGTAADDVLPPHDSRRRRERRPDQLHQVARIRSGKGRPGAGSLCNIQSAL